MFILDIFQQNDHLDAAFRSGDFSASSIPILQPGTNTPFPGNRIPANLIDPAAAKILSVLPLPNSPGSPDAGNGRSVNNLVEVGSTKPGSNATTTRIDENVSDRIRLFGTLTHFAAMSPGETMIPGPLENATGLSTTTGYLATVGYTHTWTPTLVSEMRFGFWRNNATVIPPSLGLDVASVLGSSGQWDLRLPPLTSMG